MTYKIRKNKRKLGFTLVELMIVLICLSILVGPIFLLFRSGSNSSLKGMMRIDTTLKARIVLHQIYADLKMACFPISDNSNKISFSSLMVKFNPSIPKVEYSFYSFPIHQEHNKIFEHPEDENEVNYRIPCLVTYRIEGDIAPYKLIREEKFGAGEAKQKILTDKVNFFELQEIQLNTEDGKTQYYYLITLQLIDVLHSSDLEGKKVGEKLRENQKDVILADFYDIVYPQYFNALWNDKKINRNWHTLIKSASSN